MQFLRPRKQIRTFKRCQTILCGLSGSHSLCFLTNTERAILYCSKNIRKGVGKAMNLRTHRISLLLRKRIVFVFHQNHVSVFRSYQERSLRILAQARNRLHQTVFSPSYPAAHSFPIDTLRRLHIEHRNGPRIASQNEHLTPQQSHLRNLHLGEEEPNDRSTKN